MRKRLRKKLKKKIVIKEWIINPDSTYCISVPMTNAFDKSIEVLWSKVL